MNYTFFFLMLYLAIGLFIGINGVQEMKMTTDEELEEEVPDDMKTFIDYFGWKAAYIVLIGWTTLFWLPMFIMSLFHKESEV